MDSAIGFIVVLLTLLVALLGLAMVYKNRAAVKRWLNAPYYTEDDRVIRLKRRMEDTQRELEWLEQYNAKHNKPGAETTP